MYNEDMVDIVSRLSSAQLSLDGLTDRCNYITKESVDSILRNNSDLKILKYNIRGLLGKQDQIENLLNNTITPDAVLFCETWLKPNTVDKVNMPNFKGYHKTRQNRLGGGVSILVKSKLHSRERNDLIVERELLEHIIVEIKCDRHNILLVSCYRPPNTNVKKFLKEYKSLLKTLKAQRGHEIIIGLDHNLDLLKYHTSSPTNDFLESILDHDLLPCITMPTRVTNKSATLIDNLLISRKLQYSFEPYIILDDLSDHLACLLILKDQQKSLRGSETKVIRNLSSDKIACINSKLTEIDWPTELSNLMTEESFDYFHSILTRTIDEISPEKTVTVKRKQTPKDPWMTKGILKSLSKQKSLYLKQLNDRTAASAHSYKIYRNRLIKKPIHISKHNYFLNKCKAFKQDSRKLWRLINNTLNQKESKDTCIESLRINNTPKYNAESITTEFCTHFANVGKTFANNLPSPKTSIENYVNKIERSTQSLFLSPTDQKETSTLIKHLPMKTSSEHDNISNSLLKSFLPAVLEPLEIIFNKSLTEGFFPSTMKKADVIPLFKSKDHDESNNYRPISLLLTISKILEKIIY